MAESINRKNIDLDILDYYDGKIKGYVDDKVSTGGLTIDTELSDTSENVPQTKIVKKALDDKANKAVATTTADGLMSAEDKIKLDEADDKYAFKNEIPTSLPADGGNADTVGGLKANQFVKNMSDVLNFLMVSGDHNYITRNFDDTIPQLPVVSNYMHIVGRNNEGSVISALSVGYDYTKDVYAFNKHSGVWSNVSKPYVAGTLSEQASSTNVTMSFTIFNFTPSKVLCQFGSGNAFFANVVTNGFSVTIPAGTTTINYIAFK